MGESAVPGMCNQMASNIRLYNIDEIDCLQANFNQFIQADGRCAHPAADS